MYCDSIEIKSEEFLKLQPPAPLLLSPKAQKSMSLTGASLEFSFVHKAYICVLIKRIKQNFDHMIILTVFYA